jgi:hypothetical protein
MSVTLNDDERAAFVAAPRQADMARIVGMVGKSFRDVSRRVFGLYVSHGDALDDRARAFLLAYHTEPSADARVAIVQAWKAGDDAPPSPDAPATKKATK